MSAEQAAAEHYRQLINSGKFFLEYGPKADFKDKKFRDTADAIEQYGEYKQIAYNGDLKIVYVNEKNFTRKNAPIRLRFFTKTANVTNFKAKLKQCCMKIQPAILK